MRTNLIVRITTSAAGIAATLLLVGSVDTIAAPTARADALHCFVDVSAVERGAAEVHFGFKAHCNIDADTIVTETRLWRADTPTATPQQRGDMRPDTFVLAQDVDKSYTEPCKANQPIGFWHAEVKFTASKGFAHDTDTVISTEAPPAIAC
ncbi:hypothetical protein [Nocardia sp. NBC_01327]|uniref:hypothetical protein n=1 Tax=Nocardia sp. NBC_01327 TaxID=2903593 RepID=UPI002E0E4B16|nr:hypothetical protein OG326_23255 [Nocardia sp. NBC_01327]